MPKCHENVSRSPHILWQATGNVTRRLEMSHLWRSFTVSPVYFLGCVCGGSGWQRVDVPVVPRDRAWALPRSGLSPESGSRGGRGRGEMGLGLTEWLTLCGSWKWLTIWGPDRRLASCVRVLRNAPLPALIKTSAQLWGRSTPTAFITHSPTHWACHLPSSYGPASLSPLS